MEDSRTLLILCSHLLWYSHSLSLTHSITHSLWYSHSLTLTLVLSLTLTHSHSHSGTLTHSHSLSLTLVLSLSLTLVLSLTLTLVLSLTLTHSGTLTHSHSLTLPQSLKYSRFLSGCFSWAVKHSVLLHHNCLSKLQSLQCDFCFRHRRRLLDRPELVHQLIGALCVPLCFSLVSCARHPQSARSA